MDELDGAPDGDGGDSEGAASDVGSFLARERRGPAAAEAARRAHLARWLLEAGEQHDVVVMAVCGMAYFRSPFHEYTTRRVSAVGAKVAPRPAEAISLRAAIARAEAALATGSLPSESERMRRADEASGAAVAERLAELAAELRDIGIGMDGPDGAPDSGGGDVDDMGILRNFREASEP